MIPRLFGHLYTIEEYSKHDEEEIELVKPAPGSYYVISADPDKVVAQAAVSSPRVKSFHLDPYCFDSHPEKDLFARLLRDERVKQVYFSGMLTHGQSEFYVTYIDPESHALRTHYPDFLLERADGTWVIVEVKGDDKIDEPGAGQGAFRRADGAGERHEVQGAEGQRRPARQPGGVLQRVGLRLQP